MEAVTVIQVPVLQVAFATISLMGTLLFLAWHGSSRLTKIETDTAWLKDTIKNHHEKVNEISRDVNELRVTTENKKASLFASQSPIRLTEKGNVLLRDSGLKNYIDNQFDSLKKNRSVSGQNAYEVQSWAFALFEEIQFSPFTRQVSGKTQNVRI